MCSSGLFGGGSSSAPPPPPPPVPPAEVKQPETIQAVREKRKSAGGISGGTFLTGPDGVAASDLNVTKPTLLGQ
jgi:hypothetical protein